MDVVIYFFYREDWDRSVLFSRENSTSLLVCVELSFFSFIFLGIVEVVSAQLLLGLPLSGEDPLCFLLRS